MLQDRLKTFRGVSPSTQMERAWPPPILTKPYASGMYRPDLLENSQCWCCHRKDLFGELSSVQMGHDLYQPVFDGTATLWALSGNASKAQEIATFTGSTQEVSGVAISPDGKYVATTSWDGSLRVYLTRVEDLVALAKTRVTRSLTTDECQKYLHVEQCPAQ